MDLKIICLLVKYLFYPECNEDFSVIAAVGCTVDQCFSKQDNVSINCCEWVKTKQSFYSQCLLAVHEVGMLKTLVKESDIFTLSCFCSFVGSAVTAIAQHYYCCDYWHFFISVFCLPILYPVYKKTILLSTVNLTVAVQQHLP